MVLRADRTFDLEPLHVRAALQPDTYNEETRTIEVVWSTGAEVPRYNYAVGRYRESLSLEKRHVRLDRLNAGASVLDNHDRWSGVRSVLGVVEKAWIVSKTEARALIRFSERDEVADIVRDVRAGIIRHISFGYRVLKYQDITEKDGNVKRLRAVDWEPFEVSFVTIPADANAGVRSAGVETFACEIIRSGETMDPEEFGAGIDTEGAARSAAPTQNTQDPAPSPSPAQAPEQQRSAPAPSESTAPPVVVDVEAERARGAEIERTRAADIRRRCRAAGADEAFIERMIDSGRSAEECQEDILSDYETRSAAGDEGEIRTAIEVGEEDSAKRRSAFTDVLYARMNPSEDPTEGARDFLQLRTVDMARDLLEMRGARLPRGTVSDDEIARRSLHSSGDFPLMMANAGQRTLLRSYESAPSNWREFVRIEQVNDFREVERYKISDSGALKKVPEGGAYPRSSVTEGREKYKVAKYGDVLEFTWEMMINDDLGVLARAIEGQGIQVRENEADLVWAIFTTGTTGAKLADNKGIFHADRNNTGTPVLDKAGLALMRKLMRLQKSSKGRTLNLRPTLLAVPVALEITALELMTAIAATKTGDVNVLSGSQKVIVEPRLDEKDPAAWYSLATPGRVDMIEVAYLRGRQGPEYFTEDIPNTDAVGFRVRHVVGAAPIDHRGFTRSAGTGA